MNNIQIGKYIISEDNKPFIIAEMSGNHNQSLERALEIVEAASKAGAHALKLQTYTADTITLNISEKEFFIADQTNLWKGNSLYSLYQQAHTPWEWHKAIFSRAQELGMLAFSTPFDESAVDFLETLNVPCYKIASFENNHFPLIKKVIKTGKPIIISTGMCSLTDLEDLICFLKRYNCSNYILLKCTSTYPSPADDVNLKTIPHLHQMFGCHVGLSDHTMGIGVAIASIALGARVIEKHFTLDRKDGGVDSSFSLEPAELKMLVIETERAWQALGNISYQPSQNEIKSKQFKRSIYFSRDIKLGEKITAEHIKVIRPGLGLHPKYFEQILGMTATQDITRGTPMRKEHVNMKFE